MKRRTLPFTCFCLLLSLCCIQTAGATARTNQIESLIAQGQLEKALSLTNQHLAREHENVNFLFLKGLILTKQNKLGEAKQIFIDLTQKHPELPEPFNNLAVVYAAQGDFSNATQALQQAINTHPSYATAHENLGDLYAKMASKAYNHALELDNDNQTAREKLALINDLFPVKAGEQTASADEKQAEVGKAAAKLAELKKALAAAGEQTRREQARADRIRSEVAALEQKRSRAEEQAKQAIAETEQARQELAGLQQVAAKTDEQNRQEQARAAKQAGQEQAKIEKIRQQLAELEQSRKKAVEQAQQVQAEVEQTRAELASLEQKKITAVKRSQQELAKLEQTSLAREKFDREKRVRQAAGQELIDAVTDWAKHWSEKNIDAYLASYSDGFIPPGGISREKWGAQRRLRIGKPRFIKLKIVDPKVTFVNDNYAQVDFSQRYRSDTYSDRVKKTLLMRYEDGRWLITGEQSH
ncbi:MAG: tetratricopeptide repeat protein [Gammaproteobacteria bacterium]